MFGSNPENEECFETQMNATELSIMNIIIKNSPILKMQKLELFTKQLVP